MIKGILIIADAEGCTSVASKHHVFDTKLGTGEFTIKAMEHDINAVLEGLQDTGVRKVFVLDWHNEQKNIRKKELKAGGLKLELLRNEVPDAIAKNKEDIDAVIIVGAHAKSGAHAVLPHTICFVVKHLLINGRRAGETALNIRVSYHYNKPVIFITGAYDAIEEARRLNKNIIGIMTKRRFRLLKRDIIREHIIKCVKKALAKPAKVRYLGNPKVEIEFQDGSKMELKGNIVDKYFKAIELIEGYYKKNNIKTNRFIMENRKIR